MGLLSSWSHSVGTGAMDCQKLAFSPTPVLVYRLVAVGDEFQPVRGGWVLVSDSTSTDPSVSTLTTGSSALRALLAAKEAAELAGDLDAILATFHDDPVFEFLPLGLRLTGRDDVRRFYEQMVAEFVPKVAGYRAVNTFWSESAMAMEEEITINVGGGSQKVFQFVVITGVVDGRLGGERLYGDEVFFRLLLGRLFDGA